MAVYEAEQLSRPGSFGGDVFVVERSGHHTKELGVARSGRFSTSSPSAMRDPKKRVRKTRDLYVVQGNYGYGQGWEDLTAAETRTEARGYLKDYRENEPGVPHRLIHKLEHIQLRLPGVRDPAQKDKRYTTRHRVPKWNIEPTVLQEPRLMKRVFPEMTKAQHETQAREFHRKASALHERYLKAGHAAGEKYGTHGSHISGAWREHFPASVKNKLRKMAHELSFLQAAAEAHWRGTGKRTTPPWRA